MTGLQASEIVFKEGHFVPLYMMLKALTMIILGRTFQRAQ